MRGSVSVEKRASEGLSLSTSQMVYWPLCLGCRNTAMSRLQGPCSPCSQGLSTQGPPKDEPFTQRNWPEEGGENQLRYGYRQTWLSLKTQEDEQTGAKEHLRKSRL